MFSMPRRSSSSTASSSEKSTIQFPSLDEKSSRRWSESTGSSEGLIPFPSISGYPTAPRIPHKYPIFPRLPLVASSLYDRAWLHSRCSAPLSPRMGPVYPLTDARFRKFWYGYYIDSNVLVAHAIQYILEDHLYLWDTTNLWLLSMEMIGQEAGLRADPQAQLVIVDEDAKSEVGPTSVVMEEVGTICAMVALCSNEPESFDGRPSQAKVDVVSKILMQKPRWWESAGYE